MRRFRRLRANPAMRRMVCETRLNAADFIYPIFVAEGNDIMKPVDSMPTVYQYSIDNLEQILPQIADSGISGLLIFVHGLEEKACDARLVIHVYKKKEDRKSVV